MKKLGILLMLVGTLVLGGLAVTAGPATAGDPKPCKGNPSDAADCIPAPTTTAPPTTTTTGSPGATCSHGVNDDGTCRPNPNEHGQDCDAHGTVNPAGNDGNEDHCLSTTTTTSVVTTTPVGTTTVTSEVPTTTVTETTASETSSETLSTTTASSPPPSETQSPAPSETPSETVSPPQSTTSSTRPPAETTKDSPSGSSGGPGKLAFTGPENVVPLGLAALAALSTGTGLMWLGRKRDDE